MCFSRHTMHIIKLDATESTNTYLKALLSKDDMSDYTIVSAKAQLKGRGQMGTEWTSEKGKNLTFSILKVFEGFDPTQQVFLNCLVSLAIYKTLKVLKVPGLSIKWPNDIMSGNQKICGILIENIVQGATIKNTIIGIGLNVNQTDFGKLKKVSSLKLLLGNDSDLDGLLIQIVAKIKKELHRLNDISWSILKNEYGEVLFRKDELSTFTRNDGTSFSGYIRDINKAGKLIVQSRLSGFEEFAQKEIRLLY